MNSVGIMYGERSEALMSGTKRIRGVPVSVAAKVYGKDASWVRAGIISGYLPIGVATRGGVKVTSVKEMDSRYGKINYYISPKKLFEETGYLWEGQNENEHK